jgi:hypothetical protein
MMNLLIIPTESIMVSHHEIVPSGLMYSLSQSSTAIGTDSYASSLPTARGSCDISSIIRKDTREPWEEKVHCAASSTRRVSAPEKSILPPVTWELSRALNTVQIC